MTYRITTDGTIETTSIDDAIALAKRLRGTTRPAPIVQATPQPEFPMFQPKPHTNGVSKPNVPDDNIAILLKAAGLKLIRKRTRDLYGFFLNNPQGEWTTDEVTRRLGRANPKSKWGRNAAVNTCLNRLVKLGALKKAGFDRFQLS